MPDICYTYVIDRSHEMSKISPEIQNLAQALIDYETALGNDSDPRLGAATPVIETLRLRLIKLAGVDGFRTLLSRAVALAKNDAPLLAMAGVRADGSLEFDESIFPEDAKAVQATGLVLVARLLDLLVTFIGGSLTFRLVRDEWPEAPLYGGDSTTEEQA